MRTATRKTTAVPVLPFNIPAPFDKMLKNAADKVEEVADQTRDAATRLEETVRTAAMTWKKKGETLARDPKAFAMKVTNDLSKEASRLAGEMTGAAHGVYETYLHTMNVSTHEEVRMLMRKVEILNKKIEVMATKKARRPARRTPKA